MEFRDQVSFERAAKAFYSAAAGRNDWSALSPDERAVWREEMRRRAESAEAWATGKWPITDKASD